MTKETTMEWEEIPQDNGETAYRAYWPVGHDAPMEIIVIGWRAGTVWTHEYAHPDVGAWDGGDESPKVSKEAAMSAALSGAPAEAAKLLAEFATWPQPEAT